MTTGLAVDTSRNFVAELAAAERLVADAARDKRLADHAVRECEASINEIRKRMSISPMERKTRDDELRGELGTSERKLRDAHVSASKANEKLEDAESALIRIRRAISEHPVFANAARKHLQVRRQAAKVADDAWNKIPISQILSARIELERLAIVEENIVAEENGRLREEKLPELAPRIRSAMMNVLPWFLLNGIPLGNFREQAAAERNRLIEL